MVSAVPFDSSAAAVYPHVVALVQQHSTGEAIYAGPDSPEVYFLSGKANPTPFLFDFLADEAEREAVIRSALDDPRITVAVVNTRPGFSGALDGTLAELLVRRFPHHERVDRFDVRWST